MGHPTIAETIVRAMRAGEHLLLVGPPGTGKRSAWREAMVGTGGLARDEPVEDHPERLACRAGGSFEDLVADDPADDRPGPLPRAMVGGSRLLLEHADRLDARSLAELREVIARRRLPLPPGRGTRDAWVALEGFAIDAIVEAPGPEALDEDLVLLFDRVVAFPPRRAG